MRKASIKVVLEHLLAFISAYRVPLIALGIVAAALTADRIFHGTLGNPHEMGMKAMQSGHHDEAIQHFGRALRQNPSDPAARFGLGWAYHMKGWLDEAEKQYEQAIRLGADGLHLSHYNLGVILAERKQQEQAYQHFLKAIDINDKSAKAHFNAGVIAERLGRRSSARKHYRAAVAIDPNFPGLAERIQKLKH